MIGPTNYAGVDLARGGEVSNAAGGQISGATGVQIEVGGTLLNAGTMAASGAATHRHRNAGYIARSYGRRKMLVNGSSYSP